MIIPNLIEKYINANNKLILLDYDGTLVEFNAVPERAFPSERLLNIVMKLAKKHQSKLCIITGRGCRDISKLIGGLPIDIIAEHGAMIKESGEWRKKMIDNTLWRDVVFALLNRITRECPGSFIEEKHYALAWHYRSAAAETGFAHSRSLIRLLGVMTQTYKLKILDGNKVVEVMSEEIGKGKAVEILTYHNDYDFLLTIGDDTTDEEMFAFLQNNNNAITIKVGEGDTKAKYRLKNVNEVIALLEQIAILD